MLKDLLKPNDFMAQIDLKDAYFTVPIWKGHQKFLRFLWKGTQWEFACLPFGIASAPRVFTKILKPVIGLLRKQGIRLIIYLYDVLLMASTEETISYHVTFTISLLEMLGFVVNYQKSQLNPTQSYSSWGLRVPSMLDGGSPRRTKMVERPPCCLERESNFRNPSSTDNRNRCFHNGMGSMLRKFPDQRPLVSVRKAITHKLFRTSSRRVCPEVISKKQVQHLCKANDGQYNGNKFYKQNGWANITGPVKPSLRPLAVVSRTVFNSRSTPLAGATKHCSRFRIPGASRFQRLETGPVHLSRDQQQMGPLHHRSFCKQTDNTTTQICELETRSRSRGSGCFYSGLEPAQGIRIPSICPDRAVSKTSSAAVSLSVDNCDSSVGNQPWYPLLLEMTIANPILLPSFPGLLRREDEFHPLAHLQLAAWLVSGVDTKVQQFHCQLKHCSWLHGEPGQKKLILQPGESGLVGVVNNKSIHFQHP